MSKICALSGTAYLAVDRFLPCYNRREHIKHYFVQVQLIPIHLFREDAGNVNENAFNEIVT